MHNTSRRLVVDLRSTSVLVRGFLGGQQGNVTWLSNALGQGLSRWVHIAVTLDDAKDIATLYVDGRPQTPLSFQGTVRLPPSSFPLRVGADGRLDFDEFRFALRVASASEILLWATKDTATDAPFGNACHERGRGVLLDSTSFSDDPPRLGNANYALDLFGPARAVSLLAVGTNRFKLGVLPLPLDLAIVDSRLAGCSWHCSSDIAWITAVLDLAGAAKVPLPIPNDSRLIGARLFSQALLSNVVTSARMSTNAFVSSIGH